MLENAAVITLLSFAAFLLAYFTYGRFLARRIFRLDPNRRTPSHELEDGVDYVPTRVPVLFGHHFASIAGLGPILGPAIAVIWGWLPAVLWVVVGCIFIGAVHDLGALATSLRFQGRTIGDLCQNLMGPRARLLALLIIFFLLALAMGAFVNAISGLFVSFNPDAIIPSFGLMLVAVGVGVSVYKLRIGLGLATVVGLLLFAGLILLGVEYPLPTHGLFVSAETRAAIEGPPVEDSQGKVVVPAFEATAPYGANQVAKHLKAVEDAMIKKCEAAAGALSAAPVEDRKAAEAAAKRADAALNAVKGTAEDFKDSVNRTKYWWIGALLGYAFVASVLPVWLLLQPRDYINSFQLYFALATLTIGLTVAAVTGAPESHVHAEMFRPHVPLEPLSAGQSVEDVPQAPSWLPLLFVTIACGAVSGFHSLVSSGTTVRQINRETDALLIGYGAMLTEGVLAILVIVACVAGLGAGAWQPGGEYGSWKGIGGGGLAVQLSAVVKGGAAFLGKLGIPTSHGSALLAVTIVAFAMTTLDTGTRLLRFDVEAICRSVKLQRLANRYFGSAVAVGAIAFFGLLPAGKTLWTLFGTTNQLLAALTLLAVSLFLFKLRRPVVYTLVPMLLMLAMSTWAMTTQVSGFLGKLGTVWDESGLSTKDRVLDLLRFWNKEFWQYPEHALIWVSVVVAVMSLWLIVEGLLSFARGRGGLDFDEPAGEEK